MAGQRGCSEPAVCLRAVILKGFVLKLQPFVGRNFRKTKSKIQGFTPTDRWLALCLFFRRAESIRPSDKAQRPTRIVSDVGSPTCDFCGAWPRRHSRFY